MRLLGTLKEINSNEVTFNIDADFKTVEETEKLFDSRLVIEVDKYRERRSLSANGYFWSLVDKIARKIGADKETVYKWLIRDAGVSVYMEVIEDAVPTLNKVFRLINEVDRYTDGVKTMCCLMCYYGTSTYNTAEMSHLIDLTRQEAKRLGIDVWTQAEIDALFGGNK